MLCKVILLGKKGRSPRICRIHFPPSITASSSIVISSRPSFWKFCPWDSCIPFVREVVYISMDSRPSILLISSSVVFSLPPRNKMLSQLHGLDPSSKSPLLNVQLPVQCHSFSGCYTAKISPSVST